MTEEQGKTDRELLENVIGKPVQYEMTGEKDIYFRAILDSIGEHLIRFTHIYRLDRPCTGEVFPNRTCIRYIQPIDMSTEDYVAEHSKELAERMRESEESEGRQEK